VTSDPDFKVTIFFDIEYLVDPVFKVTAFLKSNIVLKTKSVTDTGILVEGAELRGSDQSPPHAKFFFEVADCCM